MLNIVPWGGPTVRAATVLKVSPNDLFLPMVPGMIAALLAVLVLAYLMGRSEKKRLLASGATLDIVAESLRVRKPATATAPQPSVVEDGGGGGEAVMTIMGWTSCRPTRVVLPRRNWITTRTTPTWSRGWTRTGRPCARS